MRGEFYLTDRAFRITQLQMADHELRELLYPYYDFIYDVTDRKWIVGHDSDVNRYWELNILPTFIASTPEGIPFKESLYLATRHLIQLGDNYGPHLIYPFRGRMVPDTASYALNIVTAGRAIPQRILDPFCGSGTVAVEALLKDRSMVSEVICNELVPFYLDIAKVKADAIKRRLLPDEYTDDLLHYTPNWNNPTIIDIIYAFAKGIYQSGKRKTKWSSFMKRRINKIRKTLTILYDQMDNYNIEPGNFRGMVGSATHLDIPDNYVDGIVTSPPYSLALDYDTENPIPKDYPRVYDRTYKVDGSDLRTYRELMILAYYEMWRVLRKGGRIAVIIGNQRVNRQVIDNHHWTIDRLKDMGFTLIRDQPEDIVLARAIKRDWVIFMEKTGVPTDDILDTVGNLRSKYDIGR